MERSVFLYEKTIANINPIRLSAT